MACSNLTAGFTLDCNDSNGGIDKIFIANGAVESITESNGTITAITVGGSALTPSDFFEFEVPRQTSSFTETINVSQENGTVFYDQALTMIFNKMEAAKRDQNKVQPDDISLGENTGKVGKTRKCRKTRPAGQIALKKHESTTSDIEFYGSEL